MRIILSVLLFSSLPVFAAPVLTPGPVVKLGGAGARFDFLSVDAARRRLLAAHTGAVSLDIVDLDKATLVKSIPVGAPQDSALSADHARYFASVSKPPQLAIVDAEALELTGSVALDGPADLLAVDPKSGDVFACHDDGKTQWVISPSEAKITGTVELPSEGPEDLAFSPDGRLFQAMKTAGTLAVIDPATRAIKADWPTAPAASPHGIALLPGAIAIAGGNGKLVLMSQGDGKILASADIPQRVDQIACDAGMHRLYCASGLGKIAVFTVENNQLTKLDDITTTQGARSIAVDPQTHAVWVAYATNEFSAVQQFVPAK